MDTDERFRTLYDLTYRQTAAKVTAKCRSMADADDLLQEIYLELYRIIRKRGADYVKDPERLVGRLTKQKLARYYRKLAASREVYFEPDEDGNEPDIADIESLSVEEIVADNEIIDRTRRLLETKNDKTRRIFHLYYRFGLTIPEIAQSMGTSESDVKNRIYRTLKEIREYWKGENNDG